MTGKRLKKRMVRLRGEILPSESSVRRHINCKHYEDCLMKAAMNEWDSFSCHQCPVFKKFIIREKKKEDERRKALLGKSSKDLWQFG